MSTYTPIASQNLTSTTSSITFSNIPQNYTDLFIVSNIIGSGTGYPSIRFNSDTGTNYSFIQIYGNGTSAGTDKAANYSSIVIPWISRYTTTAGYVDTVNIQNYSNTTTYKTVIGRSGRAASGTDASVGTWRNTAAITTITINALDANFASGSTFSLYGIASGSPKASGGNTVTSDGTYWYHTFTSSGLFTPAVDLITDYLVVAGGAGGGYDYGGGGAGGMRCTVTATGGGGSLETPLSLSSNTLYTVTVGAGGAGGNGNTSSNGVNGSNSIFSTITSTGGGFGANDDVSFNASSGGCGGGGAGNKSPGVGGAGTANQGYAGGNGTNNGVRYAGGGGGGTGAVGTAGSGSVAGNGGNGTATSISGSSVTYGGGGGGGGAFTPSGSTLTPGTGGTGGGGNSAQVASAGTANTGGGGGAGNSQSSNIGDKATLRGGNGGSGIVIIRYAV